MGIGTRTLEALGVSASALRERILALVEEFAAAEWPRKPFEPGVSPVPVTGKVFDGADVRSLVDASLDFWLTTGRFADAFEKRLAERAGFKYALFVNSGSSANLLAISALAAPKLGDRRLSPGDEVITCASGFPTTLNPILQNGLVPVFLDVVIGTYNMDVSRLEEAIGPRTRAIFLAHALGNPFDLDTVTEVARRHGLYLVEDCCDALGATWRGRPVGTFGNIATLSFYPAHHITTGEGGAVLTSDPELKKLAESLRDWGRDCWCDPGRDNTCGKRFGWQFGELPLGYDHKYVYGQVGYNLKATDMQAAVGLTQLDKLDRFIDARRANFAYLKERLRPLEDLLVLPYATPGGEPSWFGFPVTLRDDCPVDRRTVVGFLEGQKIATRLFFGGNLLHQPAYDSVPHRKIGDLANADRVMERTFWVGVYPGLTEPMLDWIVASLFQALGR